MAEAIFCAKANMIRWKRVQQCVTDTDGRPLNVVTAIYAQMIYAQMRTTIYAAQTICREYAHIVKRIYVFAQFAKILKKMLHLRYNLHVVILR